VQPGDIGRLEDRIRRPGLPERWDDIEILREVDRQQRQYGGGPLISSGLQLMEVVAGHTDCQASAASSYAITARFGQIYGKRALSARDA
jgi:hypothetical protein